MPANHRYDIFQIDAFTDTLFMGNPAAVVPLKEWIDDEIMQQIAAENNLAETAFYVAQDKEFEIRWFTPQREVELCGHATLAAAHVLYEHQRFDLPTCTFRTQCRGILEVRKLRDSYSMNFPGDNVKELAKEEEEFLRTALKISDADFYRGTDDYLVVLDEEQSVRKYQPDFDAIKKLNARGVIITARASAVYDVVSRCFFPRYGINEDPVTGSAHTLLAPFWSEKLAKNEIVALQASRRSGVVFCTCDANRVHLRGSAVTYLRGEIFL